MNKAQIFSPATSDLWTHTFKLSWMLSFNIYKICASKMEFPDKITYYAFIFSQLFYVSTFQVLFRKSVWNLIFNKVFLLRFKQKKQTSLCVRQGTMLKTQPFLWPCWGRVFLVSGILHIWTRWATSSWPFLRFHLPSPHGRPVMCARHLAF